MQPGSWLALATDEQPHARRSRLEALRLLVLVAAFTEILDTNLLHVRERDLLNFVSVLALLVCLWLAGFKALRRRATGLACIFMCGIVLWRLPTTPNHYMLVTVALLLLTLPDTERDEEVDLALQGLRWLIVIVIVASGLQKLSYGTYFRGEFLILDIAINESFRTPFAFLLPADELERIRALGPALPGSGPFRTDWLPFVLVSNLTWIFEILAPCLLFVRRTRAAAMLAIIVFLVLIEAAAREVFFGIVAVNLLLLFGRRNWSRILLPAFIAVYAVLLLIRIVAPGVFFT